jgi:hypothetical protein
MPLEDVLKEENINEGFLASTMYLIEKKNVTTFPAWTTSPAVNADYTTRTGTFTLVATKFFKKFEILPENGDVKGMDEGGAQQLGTSNEITVEVSGVDAAKLGWFKQNKLKEFVAVVPDRSGLQLIYGDETQGCYITKIERSHGKQRGFKVTFRYAGKEPAVWNGTPALA